MTNSYQLLAPNDLISLSYRTQYCVRNDVVYYALKKKIRLKYLSATRPVLEDFLGFLKVSLSRHNKVMTSPDSVHPLHMEGIISNQSKWGTPVI